MSRLDRIDFELIALLQKDARISNKLMAEKVGIAPSTCLGRVQTLVSAGVFTGFTAEVDPNRVGARLQALIAINIERHNEHLVTEFSQYLLSLSEITQVYHLAGPVDFMVHVWLRDSDHLRDFVMSSIASRPEVKHLETELIYSHTRSYQQDFALLNTEGGSEE